MLRTRDGLTTDRDETSVMTKKQPNRWFSKAEAPKRKPDLLDPAVHVPTAFGDDQVTCASPEFDGPRLDFGKK